ncbi:alkylhydroperoxidase family enzyme [Mycobacterium sp. MAA66]|uniref:carboxymuconolactone decarboxylase family protein n=1 Tax=Mycobacterium sp. MAA66 TaxID=3156297 RepID=UPI0035187972
MTRIAYRPLDQMTARARELTQERGNLNVYRALANAENVFTGWMIAGRDALTSRVLPVRLRELIILRVAYLMDSPYEVAQHGPLAGTVGVTEQDIAALSRRSGWETDDFDGVERDVLRLTTELLTTRAVAAELVEQVYQALGAEATVEVLMVINRWSGLALMLNALDIDVDEVARVVIPTTDATR